MEEIIRTEKDRVLNVLRRAIRQDRVHASAQNGGVLQNVDAGAAQTKTQKLWRPIVDAAKEKKKAVIIYLVVMKLDNAKQNVLVSYKAVHAIKSADASTAVTASVRRIVSHPSKEEPKR